MTRRVEISHRAERRLQEIAAWTADRFGAAQALDYEAVLLDRVTALARETAHVKPLSHFTGLARHSDILTTRAGAHLLLIRRAKDGTLVISDIVHSRSDLGRAAGSSPQQKDT